MQICCWFAGVTDGGGDGVVVADTICMNKCAIYVKTGHRLERKKTINCSIGDGAWKFSRKFKVKSHS